MADLFAPKIDTPQRRLAMMPPDDALALVTETQRRLPRTSGNRWPHSFLSDIAEQLRGGFVTRLSHKQIAHVLRYAEVTGVEISSPSQLPKPEQEKAQCQNRM